MSDDVGCDVRVGSFAMGIRSVLRKAAHRAVPSPLFVSSTHAGSDVRTGSGVLMTGVWIVPVALKNCTLMWWPTTVESSTRSVPLS